MVNCIMVNPISIEQRTVFTNWQDYDAMGDNFCEMDSKLVKVTYVFH